MSTSTRILAIALASLTVFAARAAAAGPDGATPDGATPDGATPDGARAAADADAGQAAAQRDTMSARVLSITVEGNVKTKDEVVLLAAGVRVGARFHPLMVDVIKERLVDTGLFRAVGVSYIHDRARDGYHLIITAEDKHSWIIAPAYYNQPTNKGLGLGYGENNLFGQNEKLLLYGQVATGNTFFVGAYIDPSIAGSDFGWQFDTYLSSERVIEYVPPSGWRDRADEARIARLQYLNAGVTGSWNLTHRWALSLRLRGADVSYHDPRLAPFADISWVSDDPGVDPSSYVPPAPGAAGYDVSTELALEYDTRANWYGLSRGDRYRLSGEWATPVISDFAYWYVTGQWVRARRYFSSHNLVTKVALGYGRTLPFQHEYTGGGTDLRGFKNQQYRGNAQAAATVEYSVPVLTIKGVSLRALAFFDSSYTAFVGDGVDDESYRDFLPDQRILTGIGDLDLSPWKNTIGLGLRVNIRQLVLPLLGVDFGYGVERRAAEIYLAIGLTDV